jgi:hypothetical protein
LTFPVVFHCSCCHLLFTVKFLFSRRRRHTVGHSNSLLSLFGAFKVECKEHRVHRLLQHIVSVILEYPHALTTNDLLVPFAACYSSGRSIYFNVVTTPSTYFVRLLGESQPCGFILCIYQRFFGKELMKNYKSKNTPPSSSSSSFSTIYWLCREKSPSEEPSFLATQW